LINIFNTKELEENSVCAKIAQTAYDFKKLLDNPENIEANLYRRVCKI
jgi:hypothetical protein